MSILAISIIIALFVIFALCVFFKALHMFFKVISAISIVITILGVGLVIASLVEGEALKEDLQKNPRIIFVDGEEIMGALTLGSEGEESSVLQEETAKQLLTTKTPLFSYYYSSDRERTLSVDISLFDDEFVYSNDYSVRTNQLHVLFDEWLDEPSQPLLRAYFNNSVHIIPEPASFKFIRTQKILPADQFVQSRIFTTITTR